MSQRTERVAAVFKEEISRIIREELRDPRLGFITITHVELTLDLRLAKVYYSVLGSDKEKKETARALGSGSGFIRSLLGQGIKLRYLPELKFILDETAEYSINIQKILDKINAESAKKKVE
jgi:ribosome-binding factor A